jgi:hypothetical protein
MNMKVSTLPIAASATFILLTTALLALATKKRQSLELSLNEEGLTPPEEIELEIPAHHDWDLDQST